MVLGRKKKGRKLGLLFPAGGGEAASTKTVSSSGPTPVAIGNFAQTLSPALAQTPRDKSCGCHWVTKPHTRTVFTWSHACFPCAYTCLLLTSTFQQSCPTLWCYAHIFDDILSPVVKYIFFSLSVLKHCISFHSSSLTNVGKQDIHH